MDFSEISSCIKQKKCKLFLRFSPGLTHYQLKQNRILTLVLKEIENNWKIIEM